MYPQQASPVHTGLFCFPFTTQGKKRETSLLSRKKLSAELGGRNEQKLLETHWKFQYQLIQGAAAPSLRARLR